MQYPAPQTSALMSKLKSSFAAGAQPAAAASGAVSPATDHQVSLDTVEEVLTEVERKQLANQAPVPVSDQVMPGSLAQAVPQAVSQASDSLNSALTRTTMKESVQAGSLEQSLIDALPGAQVVEQEGTPEIPVEVESYMERVTETGHLPAQITLAGDNIEVTPIRPTPKQAVIILPITPEVEKEGAHQSPRLSIRWLIEWSRKIMKMFAGQVIYREN